MTHEQMLQAARELRQAMLFFTRTLTDEQALIVPTVYPEWAAGVEYGVGDIVKFGTKTDGAPALYRCVLAHTSQEDWRPDLDTSLFSPISFSPSGYPEWQQPTGAHDAYNKGDIVSYKEQLYRSLIDGNTWAPDAYPDGWEVYEE